MLKKQQTRTPVSIGGFVTANKPRVETKIRADSILRLNPAIQYVAIVDYSNTTVECKGQGAAQLSLENFRSFASISPLLVLSSFACKLESSCGRLEYVVGRFQNAHVAIYQLNGFMVVILADSTFQVHRFEEFAGFMNQMLKRQQNS